jgi:hypothetical protein
LTGNSLENRCPYSEAALAFRLKFTRSLIQKEYDSFCVNDHNGNGKVIKDVMRIIFTVYMSEE